MSAARKFVLPEEKFLPHQWKFLHAKDRTHAMIGGIGSGKTVGFHHKAFMCLLTRPGVGGKSNVGIAYPTIGLARELFFNPFCDLLDEAKIPYTANKTLMTIECVYGRIVLKSGQHPEKIVGETFTDIGIDELDALPMKKALELVRRMRERNRGRHDSFLFTVGSPEGFFALYEILKRKPNPGTNIIHAKTTDNIYLPKQYIQELLDTYDELMVKAYIEGKFVNMIGLMAHYNFQRDTHVMPVPPPPIGSAIDIGIDFNVNPLCACVGYYIDHVYHVFDEIYLNNANTYMLADTLKARYADKYIIYCYPDPTGIARKTSSFESDLEILEKAGFALKYKHGIHQKRSLNMANAELHHRRVVIDPSCTNLITDLEQVTTDDAGAINKIKDSALTHMSDAFRNVIAINLAAKLDIEAYAV